MDFELYMERPLAESLAVECAGAAVTALVACWGGFALSSEKDGKRELAPINALIVAGAGLAASWLTTVSLRRFLIKLNP